MKKLRIVIAILLVMLAVFSVSCKNEDNSADFYKTDVETYTIDNPICPLQYSVQWKDFVTTEVSEYEDGYIVKFTAVLEGKNIPMFSLALCENSDTGYLLGTLKMKPGQKNVYIIEHFDEKKLDQISEQSAEQYRAMYDDINVIISKLVYVKGMILGE